MAVYKVGTDGNAPSGLSIGDYIVTNGGTYQIVAPNTAGANYNPNNGYWSILSNANQTAYNYSGGYDSSVKNTTSGGNSGSSRNTTAAQEYARENTIGSISQGQNSKKSTVTSVGGYNQNTDYQSLINAAVERGDFASAAEYEQQRNAKISGMGLDYAPTYYYQGYLNQDQNQAPANDFNIQMPEYQEPDTSAYEEQLQAILDQMSQPYTPIDASQYTQNVMTQEEALSLADQILNPRYQQYLDQAATEAAQNLERAGIYNSVYGQNLLMSGQNQINAERQAAVNELALSLMNQDWDRAMQLYNAAVNENQYGASYWQNGLSAAANTSLNVINSLVDQANARNDYSLQVVALEIQRQAAALEAQYQAGQMTQMELENKLLELEIAAVESEMEAAQNANGQSQVYDYSGGSGSSGGSGGGGGDDDGKLPEPPTGEPDNGEYDEDTGYGIGMQPYEFYQAQNYLEELLRTGRYRIALAEFENMQGVLNKSQFEALDELFQRV